MHQRPCRLTIADKYYGGAPSIPQINPEQVFAAVRKNLPLMVQKQYGLAGTYSPQFAAQDIEGLTKQAPQYAGLGLNLTKTFGPQYAQTGYDIANRFGPQYLGLNLGQMQKAIQGSPMLGALNTQAAAGLKSGGMTPYLSQLQSAASQGLTQGGQTPFLQGLSTQANQLQGIANANLARGGVDPLLGQLTGQASEQLGTIHGGLAKIGPQDLRDVTQNTLAGFAARGNAGGQLALAQTYLNRDKFAEARAQQFQQFAGNVEQQRQGALGQAQQFALGGGQFGLGVQGARQGALGQVQQFGLGTQGALQNALGQSQNFGLSTQASNLATLQGLGGTVPVPNLAGYAQAPNLAGYASPGGAFTPMSAGIGATSGTVHEITPIAADIFSSNQSAAANQAIGGANKSSGIASGAMSAIGSIAMAY
jgi:hypothetical protein